MRVLVVSNTPFLPADAGNRRRIDRMVAHLGERGFDVGMVMLPDPDADPADRAGMAGRLEYFEVARPPLLRRAARGVAALARGPRPPAGGANGGVIGVDDWCPG